MVTIVTRAGKGSPLTNQEVDDNFTNLNNGKLELVINSTASSATITPAASDMQYNVTALAVDAEIAAPSGTPSPGAKILLRIKDNGSPRNLAWNAIYRAINVTLPTVTVANKTIYAGLVWNSLDSKWDVTAIAIEV